MLLLLTNHIGVSLQAKIGAKSRTWLSWAENDYGSNERDNYNFPSEKDINALIEQDEELRGRVYIRIQDGKIGGDVSIPADIAPGGSGRFFNASALFDVSVKNGFLWVSLSDASVNGEPIPAIFLNTIAEENLLKDLYEDKDSAKILQKIESVRIEEDKIILRARMNEKMPASTDVTCQEKKINAGSREGNAINALKC